MAGCSDGLEVGAGDGVGEKAAPQKMAGARGDGNCASD